ncbi:MAG: hypothetical protein FD174_2580 [Geobacteraceae bacterium]|nr:MAG: hypothetical protein FD174_2580 [Geobacteraceae bacterium]
MTVEVKKELEGQPEGEEAYEAAWDEIEKAEGETNPDDTGFSDKKDPDAEGGNTDGKAAPAGSEPLKEDNGKSDDDPTEKRIKDLQAGFTRVTQENAELKRTLDEFKAGRATEKQVQEQQKKADDAKAAIDQTSLENAFNEYPELKSIINPLLDAVNGLKAETESLKKDKVKTAEQEEINRKKAALDYFEANVLPKVTGGEDGHPDFKEIIASEDYFKWAADQRPSLQTAALNSNDPDDIKWAMAEYKKSRAKPEAAKLKQQEEEKRNQRINNAMTLRGGSTPFPTKSKDGDPNDYDAAWEEAEREERKKQGR